MKTLFLLVAVFAFVACVGDTTATTIDPCVSYCDAVTTNCTGDLAAYSDRDQCNQMCKFIEPGAEGVQEDTVQCRLGHANKAAEAGADKAAECKAASAYGHGVCGSNVVRVFCKRVESICLKDPIAGVTPPYPSESTCEEDASQISYDANASEGTTQPFQGADTLNCRMNHLILALGDRATHCAHTAVVSARCK